MSAARGGHRAGNPDPLGGDLLPPGPKWYRVRRAACYKSLINMRCIALKKPRCSQWPLRAECEWGLRLPHVLMVNRGRLLTRRRDSENEEQYLKQCTPTVGVWS